MPEIGSGEGKADVFYAVIRQIGTRDWPEFARGESYLNLPDSVIEDIQHDFSRSIKEQRYQMLVKWEQRLGRDATGEKLKVLANNFVGHGYGFSQSGSEQEPTTLPNQMIVPQATMSVASRFRLTLMKIARELDDDDFVNLKLLYALPPGNCKNAREFLFLLENNNAIIPNKPNASDNDKLTHLSEIMDCLGKTELSRRLSSQVRAFMEDDDVPDANPMDVDPPAPPRQPTNFTGPVTCSSNHPSDGSMTSRSTDPERSVTNQLSNATMIGGTFHQQTGDFIHQTTVNQDVYGSSSTGGFKQYASNILPTPELGIIQQLQQETQNNVFVNPSTSTQQPTDSSNAAERSIHFSGPINLHIHSQDINLGQQNFDHIREPDVENMCRFSGINVTVKATTQQFYNRELQNIHQVYPIKSKPKGHVLILSNVDFSSCWGQRYNRHGGEKDCILMQKLFGNTGLGFEVTVAENKTSEGMWEIAESFSKKPDHANSDICVVFIMSHGNHHPQDGDVFYGTDGRPIIAEDVVRLFDNDICPMLRGKPKLFFFQFCRGSAADKGVQLDKPDSISPQYPSGQLPAPEDILNKFFKDSSDSTTADSLPSRSDVLIAFATQEGNVAFRSWFTNAIANVFSRKAHRHNLVEMLNEVKRGIASNSANTTSADTHNCKEMADVRDMLLKNVYFFPGFP